MKHWNSAPEDRQRGEGALNQLPVSLCFCVKRVPCYSSVLCLPRVWANLLHRLEKSRVCGLWKEDEQKKSTLLLNFHKQQDTQQPSYLSGALDNKNKMSNKLEVWHVVREDSCVLILVKFISLTHYFCCECQQACFFIRHCHSPRSTWWSDKGHSITCVCVFTEITCCMLEAALQVQEHRQQLKSAS